MAKVHVQAVTRQGYPGFFRGGRFWSSGEPTEVEVVAAEKDSTGKPKAVTQEAGKSHRISQEDYEVLKAEPNIIIRQPGDPLVNQQTLEQSQTEIESLKAQLAAFKGGSAATGKVDEDDGRPRRRG
jgi:hypothetical protein